LRIESFNYAVQQAAWNAIPTNSNLDIITSEYSFLIKDKPTEKKLPKLWQIDKSLALKTKLN